MSEAPTRIEPLWQPLGYETTPWGRRYWLTVRGELRRCRTGQMYGLGFMLEIYPDREHWRRQFPGHSRTVDNSAALRYFVRACEKVGEYVPVDVQPGATPQDDTPAGVSSANGAPSPSKT